mgnify:FL=1
MNNTNNIENTCTVVELFEDTVLRYQDKVAAVYRDTAVTYKQLNEKANRVAELIIHYSNKKNPIVGIMIDRSLNSLITMLGIIKAGGVFLPLDGKQPQDRIKYILNNSSTDIVIKACDSNVPVVSEIGEYITLKINFDLITGANNIGMSIDPNAFAYIIYTSGTTGNPKGVKITHRNLYNFVTWLALYGNMNPDTKMLHMFSIIFDASIIETFPCLLAGGMVCILDDTEKTDPQLLLEEMQGAQALMIPSFFRAIFEYAKATNKIDALKKNR